MISGLQITLVSILIMIGHHYRLPIADADITAFVAAVLALGGVVWEIYRGWTNGTHNALGGYKKV